MTYGERLVMMRKRHAFLSDTVKGYTSLDEYARDKDECFATLSIDLSLNDNCISLYYVFPDYGYEEYHIVPTTDGRLAVSHIIWWQNDICANEIFNIFTEKIAGEEDILTTY